MIGGGNSLFSLHNEIQQKKGIIRVPKQAPGTSIPSHITVTVKASLRRGWWWWRWCCSGGGLEGWQNTRAEKKIPYLITLEGNQHRLIGCSVVRAQSHFCSPFLAVICRHCQGFFSWICSVETTCAVHAALGCWANQERLQWIMLMCVHCIRASLICRMGRESGMWRVLCWEIQGFWKGGRIYYVWLTRCLDLQGCCLWGFGR